MFVVISIWAKYTIDLINSKNLLIDRIALAKNALRDVYNEGDYDFLKAENKKLRSRNKTLETENSFLRDRVDSQRREISNLLTPYKISSYESN